MFRVPAGGTETPGGGIGGLGIGLPHWKVKADGEINNPEENQGQPDLVSDLSQGNTQAIDGSCRAQDLRVPQGSPRCQPAIRYRRPTIEG